MRLLDKQYISAEYYPLVHRMMREYDDIQNAGTETGYRQGYVEKAQSDNSSGWSADGRSFTQTILSDEKRGEIARTVNTDRLSEK